MGIRYTARMFSHAFAFQAEMQRRIAETAAIDESEALAQLRLLYRRFWLRYALFIVVFAGLVGSMLEAGLGLVGMGYLQPHWNHPWINVAIMTIAATLAAAALLLGVASHHRRQVDDCLYVPACFRCGYVLSGLPVQRTAGSLSFRAATRIVCPECQAHSPVAPPGAVRPIARSWESGRMTDRARRVMSLANGHAHAFNHEYLGTEHILLGLIEEGDGVGATVLRNEGLNAEMIRNEVEAIVKRGPAGVSLRRLSLTPRARAVLQYAQEEALSLGHTLIGTEHLLLGLLREDHGAGAEVLRELGVDLEGMRAEVRRLFGEGEV